MHKTVVINAVGLTPSLLGEHTPRLQAFARQGRLTHIAPVLPAVTTTVQTTYLTGTWPEEHGIVGNGWYFRDECEIKFWRQADGLVQRPRIWETARKIDPTFTCANLFWWYNMYSSADYAVTPRPMYPADGRKIPDVWTHPPELRASLQQELGPFPLFKFWGPMTSIDATQWIARSAMSIDRQFNPTLTLIYLPHLDYCLQRRGPGVELNSVDLRELDGVCGELLDHYSRPGTRIIVLSEYGIGAVKRPVHLNRVLREHGFITVRDEMGHELLDAGESEAFAVADHQLAHVYVRDAARINAAREIIQNVPGVQRVLDRAEQQTIHLSHPRSGALVVIAEPDAWFTYYYWLDDSRAPDFAATVDIHRKPGYDPAELFLNPKLKAPKARVAATLLKRKLGFRSLLDVIPIDGTLVRGSHGRLPASADEGPLLISNRAELTPDATIEPLDVHNLMLRHLTE